jgi:hypothetical protein
VIQDVSKRMVGQVAECIQANLQVAEPAPSEVPSRVEADTDAEVSAEADIEAGALPPPPPASTNLATVTAPPINAASLMWSVLGGYVTDPGFWDAGIKALDRVVDEVERLTERLDSLVVRSAQVDR